MSSVLESYKRKQTYLEDERDMWKKRCLEPEMQISEFDLNQVIQDPFQLPDPCVANILKYLSGKELLDVMEVCKHWKNTIEGRKAIMDRAMDEVVARFNDSKFDGYIGACVPSKRAFKHIQSRFPSYFGPADSIYLSSLVGNYAKSLVTLEIKCNCLCSSERYNLDSDDMKFFQPVTFPNLKSLALYTADDHILVGAVQRFGYSDYCMWLHRNLVTFIKSCAFPEVTKLFLSLLDDDFYTFNYDLAFNEIVCNMPKLKAISYNMWVDNLEKPANLPQLEILVCFEGEVSAYFHSLKELYIGGCCFVYTFQAILRNCKQLRILQIYDFRDERVLKDILQFPQHNNLEKLIITKEHQEERDDHREKLQKMLLAFPNLKVLILNIALGGYETLKFLALNMTKLEKLICSEEFNPIPPLEYFSTLHEENHFANVTINVPFFIQ